MQQNDLAGLRYARTRGLRGQPTRKSITHTPAGAWRASSANAEKPRRIPGETPENPRRNPGGSSDKPRRIPGETPGPVATPRRPLPDCRRKSGSRTACLGSSSGWLPVRRARRPQWPRRLSSLPRSVSSRGCRRGFGPSACSRRLAPAAARLCRPLCGHEAPPLRPRGIPVAATRPHRGAGPPHAHKVTSRLRSPPPHTTCKTLNPKPTDLTAA